jgi:hypothetical protein
MLTEKDYCDYETCVALKELGYDGYCAAYYHLFDDEDDARNSFEYAYGFDFQNSNNIYRVGAPLLYQAQKWLREKGIFVHISHPLRVENDVFWNYEVLDEAWDDGKQNPCICASGGLFDSYEEALSKGVRQAIKMLKGED